VSAISPRWKSAFQREKALFPRGARFARGDAPIPKRRKLSREGCFPEEKVVFSEGLAAALEEKRAFYQWENAVFGSTERRRSRETRWFSLGKKKEGTFFSLKLSLK
jgi:hypothetical protein